MQSLSPGFKAQVPDNQVLQQTLVPLIHQLNNQLQKSNDFMSVVNGRLASIDTTLSYLHKRVNHLQYRLSVLEHDSKAIGPKGSDTTDWRQPEKIKDSNMKLSSRRQEKQAHRRQKFMKSKILQNLREPIKPPRRRFQSLIISPLSNSILSSSSSSSSSDSLTSTSPSIIRPLVDSVKSIADSSLNSSSASSSSSRTSSSISQTSTVT